MSNKIFYKLGDIDTKVPMKDKLQKCLDLDIPILVKVPNECKVWAIDPLLDKLTKKDVILSERDFSRKINLMNHFFEDAPFPLYHPPKINTLFLGESTCFDTADHVLLEERDIKKLQASDNIVVNKFNGMSHFDEKEQSFTLKESMQVPLYRFSLHPFIPSTTDLIFQKIINSSTNSCFIICDKSIVSANEFNFPLSNEISLTVQAEACCIRERDVSRLLFNEKQYQDSPYHLEPEYHASTAFLELSKGGYDLFVKKLPVISGGNSGYLKRNFKRFDKKGWYEAGVSLIKGEGVNFNIAKEIYSHHWLPVTKHSKKKAQEIINKVLAELEDRIKVNDAYIRSIEIIIRPDKYK